MLVGQFQRYVVPGYNVTVDELRIPCHHELCAQKNHNRDKPDIWAIESKSLHAENGYLFDFINPVLDPLPSPSFSVSKFMCTLSKTGRRHHLVMDSNFLSALDIRTIDNHGFDATISCRSNRPSFIWQHGLAHKLPRGYSRVASSKRMCCVATRNKGTPKIATNLCVAVEGTCSSGVKERRDVLKIYDSLKGKADYFGHLFKAQYPYGFHRSWLTTLLVGWFYFSMTNAFILYSMKSDDLTHSQFVYQVACDLMQL